MIDLIVAKVERLCLLTDAHKARRGHRSTARIMKRLNVVTARIAAAEGGTGPAGAAQRAGRNQSSSRRKK
ncbi:hypothetical protein [Leisingera sp. ANG59]|uniref:hypothetical protein n=1 Tax=Leisingera sp. ANG59 TaxID=2675221 RepID=UPI001571C6E7|nr:hypothetical protein [Leisingera sp. ANG59]NSY36847.1 hypothetical protein [Leisingera sp. ANG59]